MTVNVCFIPTNANLSFTTGYEYVVRVYTGPMQGAGTDGKVWLMLHGENGDTGKRLLSVSNTNIKPFQRNQVN